MTHSSEPRRISRKAFDRALDRLEVEAQQSGRSLREQILATANEFWQDKNANAGADAKPFAAVPVEFLRELVRFEAGRSKRTPEQQVEKALRPWKSNESPQQVQNWYAQIYGEFAQGPLSEVMRDVLLFALRKSDPLMERIYRAVIAGETKVFEQIGRCIALVHGLRHEGTGQAAKVVSHNKKLIGLSYLHLVERNGKPPTPAEIRVDLARDLCAKEAKGKLPKFSDIWYVLRSGTTDDSDEPGPNSRYEVVHTRYIKKVLKGLKWPFRESPRGVITARVVKQTLDQTGGWYADDSDALTSST